MIISCILFNLCMHFINMNVFCIDHMYNKNILCNMTINSHTLFFYCAIKRVNEHYALTRVLDTLLIKHTGNNREKNLQNLPRLIDKDNGMSGMCRDEPSSLLAVQSTSTYVFAFYLSIEIHSSMKFHHVNRSYFSQEIVQCYDQ